MNGHEVPNWIAHRLRWAREHGWRGVVLSGWRTREAQRRAALEYSARVGKPLAVLYPAGIYASNHLARGTGHGAVDVTDPAGLARAMRQWRAEKRPLPLVGNGQVLANDPAHFSATGR